MTQIQKLQRMRGKASLQTCFKNSRSVLKDLYQSGSAKFRFPHCDDNCFEAVMINSAGGSTGGDHLDWSIKIDQNAQATITSQAYEKIYRSNNNDPAYINIHLDIAQNASLLWLPQETIFYNQASLNRNIEVNITSTSKILMVETIIFGRKLMKEEVTSGYFNDRWIIKRDDKIYHAESTHLNDNFLYQMKQTIGFNQNCVISTIIFINPDCHLYEDKANEIIDKQGAISTWNGKLIARLIDNDPYMLRKKIIALIKLFSNGNGVPKIWST